MANHKPLPDIPTIHSPTTLSVDAQSHRSQLLRHILQELNERGVESRRDNWLSIFEEVLDDLSRCIDRGNWLHGVKRGRAEKHRRAAQRHRTSDTAEELLQEPESADHAQCQAKLPAQNPLHSLQRIRQLASTPLTADPETVSYHLVLCVASPGRATPLPTEDSGFDIIPANVGCSFRSGTFALEADDGSNILFGINEWEDPESVQLVGGTFSFKGLTSLHQHRVLCRVLRLAIYIQLALILEQHFLKDSHILLKHPRPKPFASLSLETPLPEAQARPDSPPKARSPLSPTGLFSLFSRRLGRARTEVVRNGSFHLLPLPSTDAVVDESSPRASADSGFRFRRFSIIGDRHAPHHELSPPKPIRRTDPPFSSALKSVEESQASLSTSTGVAFHPPMLLVHLAEKEAQNPQRRLKGDEKVGLGSLLGWDGREARGRGMSGITGFVRQQEITVLLSRHVPPPSPSETPAVAAPPTSSSTLSNLPQEGLKLCGKPHWITYRYFSHHPDEDKPLGEAILDIIDNAELPCEESSCPHKRGKHELRLIHAGVRIVVRVDNSADALKTTEHDVIQSWESCAVCNASTSKSQMSEASYLFSFAKFLELLVYSPAICILTPSLCEHTTPSPDSGDALPESRQNIIRNFSTSSGTASFSLSMIDDIFELHVPRLQIQHGCDKTYRLPTDFSEDARDSHVGTEDEKKVLRREIRRWWEGVADHIDGLEAILVGEEDAKTPLKALPRLPSADDDYEVFSSSMPFAQAASPAPSSEQEAGYFVNRSQTHEPSLGSAVTQDSQASESAISTVEAPSIPPKDDSAQKLAALRYGLHRLEQSLYIQLAQTPASSLNDVRRSFFSIARGTEKRLVAWQKKHFGSKASLAGELKADEPMWWGKGCHAVPGANIIVQEDDWGSIIAFTLSTEDYRRELANLLFNRASPPAPASETSTPAAPSSFFSVGSGYKFFSSSSNTQPDPDKEDVAWQDLEPYSAVITRKEYTRDPTSLLSLRDVLRKNSVPVDQAGSRTGTLTSANHQAFSPVSDPVKPNVGVNTQAAGGEVIEPPENVETVEQLLHELGDISTDQSLSNAPFVVSDTRLNASSAQFDTHIRRAKASSVISIPTEESEATIGKEVTADSQASAAPPVPPKDAPKTPPKDDKPPADTETTAPSSFANTIASGLGLAMRFVMNSYEPASPPPPPKHHGLFITDLEVIDERPHIKYDWTIGKRLKFSCTVYYAKQFDVLRKRCGIDDIFIKSLSKSANWAAEGGKSKSNFWKTSDDRFIIKTLVNAWNVADLQFLIDLAPSYFRYMESTANKATALAKLLGFYTVEIRNLETGNVQSKADLLVMENLFYNQHISKTFDLKGIQGRKVKPNTHAGGTTKTLFDGEWIEGQQRTLMLVRPHSKRILREAIKSDADFLARSNIMDYSLLLGVDDTKKEISCGLVDTIGGYTFAKTLEYKAKQGLQSASGKEVTVIPPADYQERFVNALEGYFLACPDKWSKPIDESKVISDPDLLPSVL